MLFILCESDKDYFVFDLMDIEFKNGTSSLFYFCYIKNIVIRFDIFYYRQLRILFWLLIDKVLDKFNK
jgi:hypothetical protein